MAINFKNAFNKYVEQGNKLNKSFNNLVGKEVFGQMHPIEDPREFAPYSTFPSYSIPAPEQWSQVEGNETTLTLNGNNIFVSKNLDTCIKYIPFFKENAAYYTEQFKYKYNLCVEDYDTFTHYDIEYRKTLINVFVNSVYLYDDRITIIFNAGDIPVTVDNVLLAEISENSRGSPFLYSKPCGAPLFRGNFARNCLEIAFLELFSDL